MEKGYEKDGNEAFIEKYANYLDYYNYWLYNTTANSFTILYQTN